MKTILYLSVVAATCTSNLILVWVMLEINFLAFLAVLMPLNMMTYSSELITYFIVQAFSSAGMVLIMFTQLLNSHVSAGGVIILLLAIKMGLIPFHVWYLKMVIELDWELIWVLSSWQKVIPLYIYSYFFDYSKVFSSLVVTLNSMGAAILMYKQKTMKLILLFSSIFTLVWVIISMGANTSLWPMYLIFYAIPLKFFTTYMKGQDFNKKTISIQSLSSALKVKLNLILISISGVPPFIFFYLKIYLLLSMMTSYPASAMILLMSGAFMVFNYISLMFSSFTQVLAVSSVYSQSGPSFQDYLLLATLMAPLALMH